MDTDVATLRELCAVRGRADLADLLDTTTSQIQKTPIYGSHWHSFLATFVLEAPSQTYVQLRDLSEQDQSFLFDAVREIYPPQDNSVEITEVQFRVKKVTSAHDASRRQHFARLARSWSHRADRKYAQAVQHGRNQHFAEAICDAQECIELTLKALCVTLLHTYPKRHDFTDSECRAIMQQAPRTYRAALAPLFVYLRLWRHFYTLAKYGHEAVFAGPDELFGQAEAGLALRHALQCREVVMPMLPPAQA
jgi:HEPN domain-containing protein